MPASESSWPADHAWVTILAGGIGSRFWPASTPSRPKQLLPLASARPLIVDTVERARGLVPDRRVRILTGRHLVGPFRSVLPELDEGSFLVEPTARGTAPVLAWAAHALLRDDPDAVLISLHADHLVRPEPAFLALLREAATLASAHRLLVTVGAVPDRPETGYGYIQPGEAVEPGKGSAVRVAAFHEKPDVETAGRYVAEGYLWNTGIFIWRADTFLDEVRQHAPEVATHLSLLDRNDVDGFFEACPSVTVDVAVLERSRRVASIPCTFTWDDVGNWEALARTRNADACGNVSLGRAVCVDARDNVTYADDGAVVLFDVDDLVVVRTAGVTLVTRRERAPDLKVLLEQLPDDLLRAPDGGSDTP